MFLRNVFSQPYVINYFKRYLIADQRKTDMAFIYLSFKCYETDPCATNVSVLCHNRSPGYWCPPCPDGYSGKEIHGIGLYFASKNKQVRSTLSVFNENLSFVGYWRFAHTALFSFFRSAQISMNAQKTLPNVRQNLNVLTRWCVF